MAVVVEAPAIAQAGRIKATGRGDSHLKCGESERAVDYGRHRAAEDGRSLKGAGPAVRSDTQFAVLVGAPAIHFPSRSQRTAVCVAHHHLGHTRQSGDWNRNVARGLISSPQLTEIVPSPAIDLVARGHPAGVQVPGRNRPERQASPDGERYRRTGDSRGIVAGEGSGPRSQLAEEVCSPAVRGASRSDSTVGLLLDGILVQPRCRRIPVGCAGIHRVGPRMQFLHAEQRPH